MFFLPVQPSVFSNTLQGFFQHQSFNFFHAQRNPSKFKGYIQLCSSERLRYQRTPSGDTGSSYRDRAAWSEAPPLVIVAQLSLPAPGSCMDLSEAIWDDRTQRCSGAVWDGFDLHPSGTVKVLWVGRGGGQCGMGRSLGDGHSVTVTGKNTFQRAAVCWNSNTEPVGGLTAEPEQMERKDLQKQPWPSSSGMEMQQQ